MINASAIQLGSGIRIPFFYSMRGQLIFLFLAVSLIPLVVVGGMAITQLYTAKAAANEVSDNYFPSIINLDNAELALMRIIEAQKNHIIAPDDETMAAMETIIKNQRELFAKALAGFETTLDKGIETATFKKFQVILNDFLQGNKQVILLSKKNDDEKAQSLSVGTVNDQFNKVLSLMGTMRETNVVGSEAAQKSANRAARTGVILVLIASLVITVVVIFVAFWIANSIAKPILIVTKAAHNLTTGSMNLTGIEPIEVEKIIARRDEIGEIGRAFDALSNYFQEVIADLVHVSQGLAAGNLLVTPQAEYRGDFFQIKSALETALYDQRQVIEDIVHVSQGLAEGAQNVIPQAEYQGDFVQIKTALTAAAVKLAETTAQNTMQNWLKTGQAQLNDMMSGEQEIVTLAKKIISFLSTYIETPVGLFYLLTASQSSESNASLKLLASYAYKASNNRPTEFLVGEGLVGQAALEGKTIVFTRRLEECVHVVQSGLTDILPNHVLLMPFLYENAVTGVIEIGSSEALTETQQAFLQQVMSNIGIAVNTAKSRSQMEELLQHSQTQTKKLQNQSEELQSQQEELQQINEELQSQREELENKQAELQQRNDELQSQAEELQSQSEELQTQQEELKQTNEALEVRTKDLEQQKAEIQHKNIALEKTQIEMEKAKVALETKAQELELASKYKSEFLANMSHELRTPLNSLLILAQLLADNNPGNLTDKQVEYAQTIHSAGTDLLTLINEILDLSKVEAGKIEVQLEEVLLSDLVETVEHKFRHLASEKQLAFHKTLANDLPASLRTDGQRLKQILNNLLSNAFKFTNQGEVKLEIQHSQFTNGDIWGNGESVNMIAFSVIDTGIGIPSAKQQVIFEAFQQVDGSTNRRYGGTGLGLSISRQLAKLLGGELKLDSEEGNGSTFTLYLPAEAAIPKTVSVPAEVSISPTADIPTNAQLPKTTETESLDVPPVADDRNTLQPDDKSLLIIEDDRKFSNILMELAREKHFKCLVAEDGKTGLQLVEEYQPNAIIMDVGLPQLDGWTVMEILKDNPKTRHIPVHFISAAEHPVLEAKKRGAIGYLCKPVSMAQLGDAFNSIEQFLTKTMKNLLIVVDNEPHQQQIQELVGGKDIQITLAMTTAEALQRLKVTAFDCIILDMDIEQRSGIQLLEKMQDLKGLCQIPLIVYTEHDLTPAEESLLLQCADELPVKSVHSWERLLDEATLFLHQLEANLSSTQRNMLRIVHDKESILANKKVLIIDDDARNIFALATVLEEKNLEVIAGNNGNECLELLDEHPDIALVLMDIMMPEMDGYEAMQQIRAQIRFRKLPIIALTAKAMKGDKAKCIEAGANDYLSKPVNTDKLISLMRVWLYR